MVVMDGMLSLFETVAHSDCNNALLQAFLKTCTEHKAFVTKGPVVIQSVVANINAKLNSSATRYDGLLLLKTFLPQCSVEIFGENVIFWMQQCVKSVEGGQNKPALANVSYQVLKILLHMSDQMPEMKKVISGNVVTKIIDNFQQISTEEASLSMLECLEVLMCNYGPSCGQQKNVLEKCVLQYVDSSDINVIKRIAHCVAFLPLLGGGGSLGANHVSRWKQEQQKLCTTLHSILDDLFDSVREIPNSRNSVTSSHVLSLPPISVGTPLLRVYQLTARFINVSKFLQALLISEFPVEKTVLPDEILGVICRGLAVNSQTMGKNVSPDLVMVGAMLPQIHIALLKVLDCLIMCCECNLLPYAPVVCKLVLQTLKWTSTEKWAYGIEKPYGQLRVAAYNTLTLWLRTSKCGSCVELVSEQLVPVVMQDIWFEKEAVTLNVHGTSSKKQIGDQNTSEQQGVWNSRKYIPDKKANSKTCRAALQVLQCILHSAATFIKPAVHMLLQETTVGLIFDIQRASRAHDFPVPYAEASCRLELYRLLHTLVLEPHSTWPPPTQFAFHMLSEGRSDPSLEVSHFCTAALTAVEKLVHPASGTLHFPVSLEEMLELTKRCRQEYSTKQKESSSLVVTSEEEEDIQNDVHSSTGSNGSESVMCHTDNAENSSEEVVVEYDSRMEGEDGDETDEYEKEEISKNKLGTVESEESDSSIENMVSQSCGLSEMLSKTNDKQKVLVTETRESDEDLQHKETESESVIQIRGENYTYTDVGVCEKDASTHYSSRTDNKILLVSCVRCDQEPSVVNSIDSRKSIDTSPELANEGKLLSDQQQKINTEHKGDESNKCEKGNKDITASTDISAARKSRLVTENEEDRQDNGVVRIVQEDDDCEPNSKRMKLGSTESPKKCYKSGAETSDSNVKDCTAVPRTMNGKEEQQVHGVGQDPELLTEEEMLQSFVDAVTE